MPKIQKGLPDMQPVGELALLRRLNLSASAACQTAGPASLKVLHMNTLHRRQEWPNHARQLEREDLIVSGGRPVWQA